MKLILSILLILSAWNVRAAEGTNIYPWSHRLGGPPWFYDIIWEHSTDTNVTGYYVYSSNLTYGLCRWDVGYRLAAEFSPGWISDSNGSRQVYRVHVTNWVGTNLVMTSVDGSVEWDMKVGENQYFWVTSYGNAELYEESEKSNILRWRYPAVFRGSIQRLNLGTINVQ